MPAFVASRHLLVYAYMVCKFTSRWAFYGAAARLAGAPNPGSIREVVNPRKDSKILEVCERHGLDAAKFGRVCRLLRRVWPLPP